MPQAHGQIVTYDSDTELLFAVYNQDIEKVKELLATGGNPNAKDYSGISALAYAIMGENESIAWLLISEGANANAPDRFGRNILMHAIIEGQHHWVEKLIPLIENINHQDISGYTAMVFASESYQIETIEMLFNAGADLNISSVRGTTPLMHAAAFGDFIAVSFMLENGVDPLYQAKDGSSALHLVAWYGHNEIAGLLIDFGADMELKDMHGNTPLIVAVINNQPDMVWYLIESGASPGAVNNEGYTGLSLASASGKMEVVDVLLKYDFIEPKPKKKSKSALGYAFSTRNTKLADQLRASRGIRPKGLYFSEFWITQGFDFNSNDFMHFNGISIFEARLGLLLNVSFQQRIGHQKLLVPYNESFFYQFHEKRYIGGLGISKEQKLITFKNGVKSGLQGGIDLRYSTAQYRGSGINPPEGFSISPILALFAHHMQFTFLAAWNFYDSGQPATPPHRYRISLSWRIPLYNPGKPIYEPVLK
jgi:ankyrin repeat protein